MVPHDPSSPSRRQQEPEPDRTDDAQASLPSMRRRSVLQLGAGAAVATRLPVATAQQDTGELPGESSLPQNVAAAVDAGVSAGIEASRREGVDIGGDQRTAIEAGAVEGVAGYTAVDTELIQAATTGATTGALLQSPPPGDTADQSIWEAILEFLLQFVTDNTPETPASGMKPAVTGSVAGSLEPSGPTDAEQVRSIARGSCGGATSQSQQLTASQSLIAAFGAARGCGREVSQSQSVDVAQLQRVATGSVQGCGTRIEQTQDVSIRQLQNVSAGAAAGGTSAVSQYQNVSAEQSQALASGTAEGCLEGVDRNQQVSVEQVQYAATGTQQGCASRLTQVQDIDVEQVQSAARGSAQGAVGIQDVDIDIVQRVAFGTASGVVSRAEGASPGQIERAAIVADQSVSTRISGRSIDIEAVQSIANYTAGETVRYAREADTEDETELETEAETRAQEGFDDPDSLDQPDEEPEEPEEIQDGEDDESATPATIEIVAVEAPDSVVAGNTLEVIAEIENTGDRRGYKEVVLEIGDRQWADRRLYPLGGGRNATLVLSDGTAHEDIGTSEIAVRTEDDRATAAVDITGSRETEGLGIGISDVADSIAPGETLEVTVDAENPNDEPVTRDIVFTVDGNSVDSRELTLSGGETETFTFTYELPADDGREELRLRIETDSDNDTQTVAVEGADGQDGESLNLLVSTDGRTVAVENPTAVDVIVTATSDDGEEYTLDVAQTGTVYEEFEPGTYTLTGEAEDGSPVTLNDAEAYELTVEESESDADDETGTIRGYVEGSETGYTITEVVEEATVSVQDTEISDSVTPDGVYTLEDVPTGEQTVVAEADGYTSESKEITLDAGETEDVDFELQPEDADATDEEQQDEQQDQEEQDEGSQEEEQEQEEDQEEQEQEEDQEEQEQEENQEEGGQEDQEEGQEEQEQEEDQEADREEQDQESQDEQDQEEDQEDQQQEKGQEDQQQEEGQEEQNPEEGQDEDDEAN